MQYSNIFLNPGMLVTSSGDTSNSFARVSSFMLVLIPSGLTMGVLLLAMRRWQLPFGAVALMLTVNAVLMMLMRYNTTSPYWMAAVAALIGGLFADVLIARLHPSVENVGALRLFAFIVPFVFFLLVFGALVLSGTGGLWWRVHTWLGVPFLAGAISLGLSFLVAPLRIPEEA
jgi:hypothetical protein